MNPQWVYVKSIFLARGYGVHFLCDISQAHEPHFAVALSLDRRIYSTTPPLPKEQAVELFETWELGYGPRGDSSWRAVLDRLMGKPAEAPGVWAGSVEEYVSRFLPLGSWEWLERVRQIKQFNQANGDSQ